MPSKRKDKFELELQPMGAPSSSFSMTNSVDDNVASASLRASLEENQSRNIFQSDLLASDDHALTVTRESLRLFELESLRLAHDYQNSPARTVKDKDPAVSVIMITTFYCAVLIIASSAAGVAALPVAAWLIGATLVTISIGLAAAIIRDSCNDIKTKRAEMKYQQHIAAGPAAYQHSLRQASTLVEQTEHTPLLSVNR